MAMTENWGPINFESKEIYKLNDSSRDIGEAKSRNHKVIDDLSLNNADETVDSPRKEVENGLSHNPEDSEHECLITVEEHTNYNKKTPSNPSPRCDNSSYQFKAEVDEFAEKSVSEVCYKEMDQHTVKDICVDEGNLEKGVVLIESDDKDECFDKEFIAEQELKDSDTILKNDSSNISLLEEKTLVEEIDAESLIGSFLKSFEGEENVLKQWPQQVADEDNTKQETGNLKTEDVKETSDASGDLDNQIQPGNRSRISTTISDLRVQKDDGGGETSFSAASLINYEPVPFSGSISHRSDSSATSARSFAFPVLQSEWNSSPVRMAKADRRHLRKQRWRSGLFCCRF